jgi:hypothetical protein
MPRYFVTDTTALDSTADSALQVMSNASTAHRGYVSEIHVSFGTPADLISPFTFARSTDAGTGDSPTVEPYDSYDVANRAVAKGNLSAEPTTGDTLFELDVYHRLNLIYKTPVDRPFIWPATTSNGFIGKATHASSTNAYRVSMVWEE